MPPALALASHAAHITVLGKRFNTRGHLLDAPLLLRGRGKRITLAHCLALALLRGTVAPSLALGSVGSSSSERLMQAPRGSTGALVEPSVACKSSGRLCVARSVISQQRVNDSGQAVRGFARVSARMRVSLAHAWETSGLRALLTLALSIQTLSIQTRTLSIQTCHLLSPQALSFLAQTHVCPAQLDLRLAQRLCPMSRMCTISSRTLAATFLPSCR